MMKKRVEGMMKKLRDEKAEAGREVCRVGGGVVWVVEGAPPEVGMSVHGRHRGRSVGSAPVRWAAAPLRPACMTAGRSCPCGTGSMYGAREVVAKALALECMRGAHRQQRKCYLYAFRCGAPPLEPPWHRWASCPSLPTLHAPCVGMVHL